MCGGPEEDPGHANGSRTFKCVRSRRCRCVGPPVLGQMFLKYFHDGVFSAPACLEELPQNDL